jgi:hypothetical protein
LSDDETPAESPELRTPAHGRGKLRRGGSNGGAGGRPPDEIRKALRGAFWKHRARLEEFALSDDPTVAMKALDMLAKYGVGTPTAAVDAQGNQTDIPLISFKPQE